MKKISVALTFLLIPVLLFGCSSVVPVTESEWVIIPLPKHYVLDDDEGDYYPWYTLDLEHSEGNILVTTWENEDIGIRVVKTVSGEEPEIIFEQIGIDWDYLDDQTIEVDTLVPDVEYDDSFTLQLEIYLPEDIQVDLESESSNGSIKITGINGNVEAETSNGDIEILGIITENILYVETSNGNIVVEDVTAEAVEIKTSNGNIDASDIRTHLKAETSNGYVKIDGSEGWLEATSSGDGDITLRNIKLVDHCDIEGSDNDIYLEIIAMQTGDYEIETSNGDIEIWFPAQIEDVGIELELLVGNGVITSNFLDIPDDEEELEIIYPEGAIDPIPVLIKTSNGNISLNK